ncbi:hypothetical protein J8J14_19750 [Roseomonas sp. SSH11]|uniref:Uncharacterized protein n=1 Tax=Pararoseomonas baculiformis TaxID=2820812 RepID=A0ABS4AJ12_9PROT|nr:hypothetical protein [Pararoseomonas baculiformis]MBP0447013.1 hypothetical protein [Pararoseomonas baculiformis]
MLRELTGKPKIGLAEQPFHGGVAGPACRGDMTGSSSVQPDLPATGRLMGATFASLPNPPGLSMRGAARFEVRAVGSGAVPAFCFLTRRCGRSQNRGAGFDFFRPVH